MCGENECEGRVSVREKCVVRMSVRGECVRGKYVGVRGEWVRVYLREWDECDINFLHTVCVCMCTIFRKYASVLSLSTAVSLSALMVRLRSSKMVVDNIGELLIAQVRSTLCSLATICPQP